MGYTTGIFSSGEVPTTAIWNELWSNDTSFNNGTGFANHAFLYSHLATGAISSQVVSTTNSGSGGGTMNSLQIGGLKMAWGISRTITNGATGQGVVWPFTLVSLSYFSAEMTNPTVSSEQFAYWEVVPSGTSATFGVNTQGGGSSTCQVAWLIIGT